MKRLLLSIILTVSVLSGWACAETILKPHDWVNDFAGVVSDDYRDKITSIIRELEEKTGSEIFVLTVASIAPYDENSYARMIFDSWKPGKKGKDNGVLVLLAVKERRWRIETGYGVEGVLPDGLCGQIGRGYMVPYFKKGEYGQGLYYGVVAIANIIAKDAKVGLSVRELKKPSGSSASSQTDLLFNIFVIFFILAVIIQNLVNARRYYRKHGNYGGYWTSGGFGGGGGGFGGGGGGCGGGGGAGGGF